MLGSASIADVAPQPPATSHAVLFLVVGALVVIALVVTGLLVRSRRSSHSVVLPGALGIPEPGTSPTAAPPASPDGGSAPGTSGTPPL